MAGWGAAVGATTEALSGAASNVYAAKQAKKSPQIHSSNDEGKISMASG